MPKFILLLAIAFVGNSMKETSPTDSLGNMPIIEFSNPAIDFESGQPVFSKTTDAFLSRPDSGEARIFINDSVDVYSTDNQIDLATLIDFTEGTYTVVIQGKNYEEVFGFTIR